MSGLSENCGIVNHRLYIQVSLYLLNAGDSDVSNGNGECKVGSGGSASAGCASRVPCAIARRPQDRQGAKSGSSGCGAGSRVYDCGDCDAAGRDERFRSLTRGQQGVAGTRKTPRRNQQHQRQHRKDDLGDPAHRTRADILSVRRRLRSCSGNRGINQGSVLTPRAREVR